MSTITLYHDPASGTSRRVLELIRGREPTVIEYLKTPPDRATLRALIAAMGVSARAVLRAQGTPYADLDLAHPKWSDEDLIGFMVQQPTLIERPIVVTPLGVRLCRPSHLVLELLAPRDGFDQEGGGPRVETGAAAVSESPPDLPNIDAALFRQPDPQRLPTPRHAIHAPRFLLLYGSLRVRSYSRLLAEEAARVLRALGGETRLFDPSGLPLVDAAGEDHPKVQELREAVQWAEGMVWSSPERHGAMTGLMKTQIDWVPLSVGALRPTQGKTLALLQVSGGSQSFNAVNQMRVIGRWMRMLTIPNQSSVARAHQEFDAAGRMKPSAYYDRLVDVMEELMKFTLLTREVAPYLVDRYSERKENAEALSQRVNLTAI